MPVTLLQWGPVLSIGAIMIAMGLYSAFFGLSAERRRTRLIYGLTLFAYMTWIYPALLGLVSGVLFMHPDPHVLRIGAVILQGAGLVIALYVSGRHAGYVFRIICCSIGVLVGLTIGLVLRTTLGIASPIFGIVVPAVAALIGGWIGWQKGPTVRAGWKIACFAAAGAGMTASGSVAIIIAWLKDEPLRQTFDLVLSILSPPLKFLISDFSIAEMLASAAVTAIVFALGAATQCAQLRRTAPGEAAVCDLVIARLAQAGKSLKTRS